MDGEAVRQRRDPVQYGTIRERALAFVGELETEGTAVLDHQESENASLRSMISKVLMETHVRANSFWVPGVGQVYIEHEWLKRKMEGYA